jgi:hypothetical protein
MEHVVIGVASSASGFLQGVLILGMIVIGLTFVLTLGMCSIHDRKKQLITTFFLLCAVLLWFTLPMLFQGKKPEAWFILQNFASLLLIALAIITPGILWVWPEKRENILKDTLICSVLTLTLGVSLYAGVCLIIPVPTLVLFMSQLLTVVANLPGGTQLILLLIFAFFATLAYLGYWIIRTIRSRVAVSG